MCCLLAGVSIWKVGVDIGFVVLLFDLDATRDVQMLYHLMKEIMDHNIN